MTPIDKPDAIDKAIAALEIAARADFHPVFNVKRSASDALTELKALKESAGDVDILSLERTVLEYWKDNPPVTGTGGVTAALVALLDLGYLRTLLAAVLKGAEHEKTS